MGTTKTTFAIYWRATKRYQWQLVLLLIILPPAALAGTVAVPYFVSQIIADLIDFSDGQGVAREQITWHVIVVGFLLLIDLAAWRTINYVMTTLQVHVLRDLDAKVHKWLLNLSYSFHTQSFSGSLIAKGKRFISEYERIFDTIYFEFVPISLKLFAIILILSFQSLTLTLLFVTWMTFYIILMFLFVRFKSKYSRAEAKTDSLATAHFADTISNVLTVKGFGREAYEHSSFQQTLARRHKAMRTSWVMNAHTMSIQQVIQMLIEFSLLGTSVYLVFEQHISVAELVLLQLYVKPLLTLIWNLSRRMSAFERSVSQAAEMTELFLLEPEIQDTSDALLAVGDGAITFENVSFSYSDQNEAALPTVLDNFSLTIEAKQKIGLVGPSGGGKTTLTKLLLRFGDVNQGTISIDDQPIDCVTQQSLRHQIAYVAQEPLLFHRTLRENIAYGNPDATFTQIEDATKRACAHHFIEQLPNGYDTLVGERGTKLSGGEKQRVAIARAILKDAPILILDEATSALDSESEHLIQQGLHELMKDRTTIVIAHRLSTVASMDRILVLEEGHIVEDGLHNDLLTQNNLYADLWKRQMKA